MTDTEKPDADVLRETLEAAYDEAAEPEQAEPAEAATETTEATEEPKDGRARDESGRFVKTETKPEAVEPEKAKAETAAAPAEQVETTETEKAGPEAPPHWSAADRDMFSRQAPEAREWLLKRHAAMEADHTRKLQEVTPFRKVAEHWKPYLDQLNASPDQAFHYLMNAEYQLRHGTPQQKQAALMSLAQQYGISLQQAGGQTQTEDPDPILGTVRQIVEPIARRVEAWEAKEATRATEAARQAFDQTLGQLKTFEEAKTEAGTLAHPFFHDVLEEMVQLASVERSAGRTPDLKALYERATWANPTIRAKLIAAQTADASRKETERRKTQAAATKKAAVSVTGAPSAPSGAAKRSLREEIATAMEAGR